MPEIIAADLDQMRPTPVASLLQAAARNAARGYPDAALAELGAVQKALVHGLRQLRPSRCHQAWIERCASRHGAPG